MERRSISEVLTDLDDALKWLRDELKLRDLTERSRFAVHHAPLVRRLTDAWLAGGDAAANDVFKSDPGGCSMALTESEELAEVLPLLRSVHPALVRPKMERALLGPPLPTEEDENSNVGRNTLFELVIAAKLQRAGYEPVLGIHPDLACAVDGRKYLIECKRPASKKGIRKGIKRAGAQLQHQLRGWRIGAGTRGIAALSLTKAVNPGDSFLRYTSEDEARTFLGDFLEQFDKEFYDTIDALPQKIVGLIWHVITPAVDEGSKLFVVAQQMLVHKINREGVEDDGRLLAVYERLQATFGWTGQTSPTRRGTVERSTFPRA